VYDHDRRFDVKVHSSRKWNRSKGALDEHGRSLEVAACANASSVVRTRQTQGYTWACYVVSHQDDVHVEALSTLAFGDPAPMKRDTT
jgi:hypothetical protein